jgi:hypothetical protein
VPKDKEKVKVRARPQIKRRVGMGVRAGEMYDYELKLFITSKGI